MNVSLVDIPVGKAGSIELQYNFFKKTSSTKTLLGLYPFIRNPRALHATIRVIRAIRGPQSVKSVSPFVSSCHSWLIPAVRQHKINLCNLCNPRLCFYLTTADTENTAGFRRDRRARCLCHEVKSSIDFTCSFKDDGIRGAI